MGIARSLMGMLLCLGLLVSGPALALDPARSLDQYKHTHWSTEDGAPGVITALAQGLDGYLWIASRDGLYRFDGIRFERIPPAPNPEERTSPSALLAARDGSMWVGYAAGGIERYRAGGTRDMRMPTSNAFIMAILQTQDGAIWAQMGAAFPQFARYADGRWQEIGENWGLPPEQIMNTIVARDGTLWLTTTKSILFLKSGARHFERHPAVLDRHGALSEDASGRIWISDDSGTRALTGGVPTRFAYPTPPALRSVRAFFDRDGNLWSRSGRTGIYRVQSPQPAGESSPSQAAARVSFFQQRDGLTSDNAIAMLEDREGSIWIGTSRGLDQFRPANVIVEPMLLQVPTWGDVLLGAADGSVYVGDADRFYRILPGKGPEPIVTGTGEAEAICEAPDGTVWMVSARRVTRLAHGSIAGFARPVIRQAFIDCAVSRDGTLWLTAGEGLFRRTGTGWQIFPLPDSNELGGAKPILARRDGTLIVARDAQSLYHIDFPSRLRLALARPLSLSGLRTAYESSDSLLLGGGFGLARLRDGRAGFLGARRTPALDWVTGIVQTPERQTWVIGGRGIAYLPTAALDSAFDDPRAPLDPAVLDFRDGLPAFSPRDGKRDAVRGGDGRLWFATTAGVVWVDPTRLARNATPPPVAISTLRAGSATYRDPRQITLPAGTASVEIDYAALSLAIPDRVEVRYRLDGADDDWIDPGTRRQAFYTRLGPGTYRFRIIAANNDGVWNREGATLEFVIPPTFFQSNWFTLLVMLGFGALLWLAYSIRVRQLTARMRAGLQVRLAERERIARELHDTLLQSFQGLVLRFQAVAERIPADQPLRQVIDQALERADAAMIEGRDRVRELRAAAGGELDQALIAVAEECAADGTARFNLTVEGHARTLHPMVRDEVEHIGAEAIRNAFRHARANEIEAVLTYRAGELRFDLRDDGLGLPAGLATGGAREGHFGLTGMRERAQRIGGTLTIRSRRDTGTEVVLSIPASTAYVGRRGRWRLPPFLRRRLGLEP